MNVINMSGKDEFGGDDVYCLFFEVVRDFMDDF